MNEKVSEFLDDAKFFVKNTWKDFVAVWKMYPNVHIWWTIAFLIALFV